MKKSLLSLLTIGLSSFAMAGNHLCQSQTQTFVLKQRDYNMYLVYECNKNLTACTPAQVFESLGYEEEGSFTLHGQRASGQRSVLSMVKNQDGWAASLSLAGKTDILDVLKCEPYRK